MAKTICPHCNASAHMTRRGSVWRTVEANHDEQRDEVVSLSAMLTCDECSRGLLLLAEVPDDVMRAPANEDGWWQLIERFARDGHTSWWPLTKGRTYVDVPAHIASAAGEAHTTLAVGAFRSSVLLARAVVESTAKAKGITKGTLEAKVDEMLARELIRQFTLQAAHEVRHLGNEMAHGDFTVPVTALDAELTLIFMAEVLDDVFQAPARVQHMRDRRAARTTPSS